jgi:hypothetical protein
MPSVGSIAFKTNKGYSRNICSPHGYHDASADLSASVASFPIVILEAGLQFVICELQITVPSYIDSGFNVAAPRTGQGSKQRAVDFSWSVVIGSFSRPPYQRGGRIAAEYCVNVVQSQHTHGCAGLYRSAPNVR